MAIQYALKVFEYEDQRPFRIVDRDGAPWFVLTDVCAALGLTNPSMAAQPLDADEKSKVNLGFGSDAIVVNEAGLYTIILRSRDAVVPGTNAYKFRKWVTAEVLPAIRKTGAYGGNTPAFIRRYNQNYERVSAGHFSVMNELVIRLWGRFEHLGHIMADTAANGTENRPDVSVGKGFSKWLQRNHPNIADNYTLYWHWTPAGEFKARQYPLTMIALFHEYLDTVWFVTDAPRYFNTRDPAALPHVPYLLPTRRPAPLPPR
jgi:prophage antirepressor-like protein